MKISIKILTVCSLLFFVACGVKKSTQSKMEKNQQEMATQGTDESQRETSPDDSAEKDATMGTSSTTDQMKDESKSGSADDKASAAISNPSAETMNRDANSKMYSRLKMTEGQVRNFENSLEEFKTRQLNMANGEMLGTVADEKNRLLKEILFPEQYSTYQAMAKKN